LHFEFFPVMLKIDVEVIMNMRLFLFLNLVLGFVFQVISYPYVLYSVQNRKRESIPQWFVQVAAREGIDRALGLPALGIYHGDHYNLRGVFVIKHTNRLLDRAPRAIRNAINGRKIDYYTMIWGPYESSPGDKPDNIVLHPIVERWRLGDRWRGEVDNSDVGFNIKVTAGVFGVSPNVRAITGAQIPRDRLEPIDVNYHDKIYFSPDNGRIGLPKNKNEVATFWLVASDPNSNKSIVVFNIVALNEKLGIQMVNLAERMDRSNWRNVLNQLRMIPVNNREVLNDAIGVVEHDFMQNDYKELQKLTQEITDQFLAAIRDGNFDEAKALITFADENFETGVGNLFRNLLKDAQIEADRKFAEQVQLLDLG